MAELVGGAALGAAFQGVSEGVVKLVKKGYIFRRKLSKIRKKLKALEPLIHEVTRLNIELDLSTSNNDIIEVMKEGKVLMLKMEEDSEKGRWFYFPFNTGKLAALDGALNDLLLVLQLQGVVVGMRILGLVQQNNLKAMGGAGSVAAVGVPGGGMWCCGAPAPPPFDVGLEIPLRELGGLVLGEDVVTVVVAPPGCGKTTLVQKLCKNDQFKERFKENILFVKVSRKPNLSYIVEQIYEHYGRKVPNFQDEEDACNSLKRLLGEIGKSSPTLLVLDDVWSDSDSMIDRLIFQIPEYKILVTSRFEFPRFKSVYKLKMLNDEEAVTLFSHYAQLEGTTNIPKSLVQKVVQHCKRCPLALQLIGSALCGQSPQIWRRESEKWSKRVSSILDSKDELLLQLQSSVEVLGETDDILKECFIDLGSFPEDRRIPVTALIDIWSELYGIEEHVSAAYPFYLNKMNMATVIITRSDIDEDDDYYSEHFLTMHDMLRELAIHNSNQNSGKIKRLVMELPESETANLANASPRLLAISTDGMLSSEWQNAQVIETEVLVLNFMKKDQVLPDLIQRMKHLKVLIVTNYGFYPSELHNFQSISYLTNLKKIRIERVKIPGFAEIQLENLQKLSFFMCKVGQAFSSVNIQKAFPNLVDMNIDYCDDLVKLPDGLCDLSAMKTLSVTHCHKLTQIPEEIGRMSKLVVLRLRYCIGLEELPNSICDLPKLEFLDISDCFSIANLPEDIGKLKCLTKLNMKGCSRLKGLPPSVLDFGELEQVVCDEDIKELWELSFSSDSEIELIIAKEYINLNFL